MHRALASFCALATALGATTAQAGGKLQLPPVEDAPTETVTERGDSPVYYRLPDNSVYPWFRPTFGASSRLPANAVVPLGDLRKPFGSRMARLSEIAD